MKTILIALLLTTTTYAECFKTPGSKAFYKPFKDYPNVLEKYEPKEDGRFLASFEAAKTEEGEVIYQASGIEKVSKELQKEDYFKVDCPVGMK